MEIRLHICIYVDANTYTPAATFGIIVDPRPCQHLLIRSPKSLDSNILRNILDTLRAFIAEIEVGRLQPIHILCR